MNGISLKYPKIQSIFKRDENTHQFIEGKYSLPEFEYLKDLDWEWTEKIDGMNIRVIWDLPETPLIFKGRTDKTQVPKHLLSKLEILFPWAFPEEHFPEFYLGKPMCLYGEGFGHKIQSGEKYLGKEVDFMLFDVLIDNIWLQRKDVEDIAKKLGIKVVPCIGKGNLKMAIDCIKARSFKSSFGDFLVEGFVLKPLIPLLRRNGERVITKIKHVDYKEYFKIMDAKVKQDE